MLLRLQLDESKMNLFLKSEKNRTRLLRKSEEMPNAVRRSFGWCSAHFVFLQKEIPINSMQNGCVEGQEKGIC